MGLVGNKYLLHKEDEGVYISVEYDADIKYPVDFEQICADLAFRNITFDPDLVEETINSNTGEKVLLCSNNEEIVYKPLVKVKVSSDMLQAYLIVIPFTGGEKLNTKDLQKALENEGIKHGIKEEILPEILNNQGKYGEWLIAEGLPLIKAKDATIIYHFNPKGIEVKPNELEDGKIDFYNLNLIQLVSSGTVIAEKIPAEQGQDGINVYGERSKVKPAKDVRLPIGQNTQAIDNNTKLIATKEGHVILNNNKVSVLLTYQVNGDVDFNTGNIKYPGNVVISGSVRNGFTVEATGDIEVGGLIEGNVIGGSNIQVKKGIVQGRVVAEGNIYAKVIENGYAECKGEIVVTEAIMHSTTKAVKSVNVGGKKGLLVGGECSAGEEIYAKNIGASLGTATKIAVGILPELRDEYKKISKRIIELTKMMDSNNKILKKLHEIKGKFGMIPPDKNELFIKSRRIQYQGHQEMEECKERKMELEIMFQQMEDARISVERRIYSGVEISIGKSVFHVKDQLDHVTFKLDGLDIKSVPFVKKKVAK